MNKLVITAAVAAMMVALAGCTTPPKEVAKPKASLECTFPNTTELAPGWVCDQPVEGIDVYAVGIYEKTAAGLQFQKDQAVASARVNLAQQMKTHVANMIKQYVETTGAGSSETVDKVNTSVSKLITKETLEGSKVFMTKTDSRGTMYALVGFDTKLAQKKTEDVLKTSMKNERALWQQFKAQKGQDELAAEIAKMDAPKQ